MSKIFLSYYKKFLSYRQVLFDLLAWLFSKHELDEWLEKSVDFNNSLNAVKSYMGRGHYADISTAQHDYEIQNLFKTVQTESPKTIVEIGTKKGGTLFLWCRMNQV